MAKDEKKKEDKKEDKKEAKLPLTPEQEAAKGKKKRLILFGAIGAVVLGGGAAAAFLMLGKGSAKPGETAHGAAAPSTKSEEEGDPHAKPEAKGHDASETKKSETKDEHGGGQAGAKKEEAGGGHGDAKKDDHGGAHGDAKKDDHGGGHGDAKVGAKPGAAEYTGDFGLIKELKPFHLNLGNPLENRYVRLALGLEYKGGPEQLLEIERRDSQIRDAIVSIISRKTREHLLSPDGKDRLRLELKNKINQYLDKKIENVFITDILIE
ncbi:MAG: flagellar basal body-associated FliL family protein [Proteobacteria bacterium]|nr:flagellar basal body-associated FliL family protein [Pseudomonadota bacterium]